MKTLLMFIGLGFLYSFLVSNQAFPSSWPQGETKITAEQTAIQEEPKAREDILRRLREAHTHDEFRRLEWESRAYPDIHEVVIVMWDLAYIDKARTKNNIKELEKMLVEVYPSGKAYNFIKDKIEELKKPKQ